MTIANTSASKNAFKQYFEIIPAFSNELKDEVYRIRHNVYCEELNFEPVRADKKETDEHDAHSQHLLIRSIKADEFVGCTRIIFTPPDRSAYQLPVEMACNNNFDKSIIDLNTLPRNLIAEVSRLAVIASYRKRKSDHKSAISISNEDYGTAQQPRFPYIPVGLYLGSIKLAQLNGIEHVLVLTEPRLAKHFRKLGFDLELIGDAIEHRGQRIPSLLSISGTIKNMNSLLRTMYNGIASDIDNYIANNNISLKAK